MSQDFNKQFEEQMKLQQQVSQLEETAKMYMTREAITRYGNLKSAHPEKALQAIIVIAQAVQSGQLREKISDYQFKQILKQMEKPKKEFRFTRK